MRVLINALNAGNRSGTGRYITELIKALLSNNDARDYIFAWPRDLAAPFPDHEKQLARRSASPLLRLPLEYSGMGGMPERLKADLLHYPTGIGPKYARRPVVLTVHDLCFFHHPEWFPRSRALYYRHVMAAGIRRADHLIADSQATADDLVRILHIPESRIDVVPLGVDSCFQPASPDAQQQLRLAYGLPERFFLFVGTLEPRKNLDRVIQAWTQVPNAPPLVIAGRYGWGNSGLPPDSRKEGIVPIGHVPQEQLPALYSAATAFIWPSLMEGFGLPPLEAMACGTPTITSNSSSLPEVVGDAAIQVDPLDVDALADAMRRLSQDHALRQELRQRGIVRAARFSWRETASRTIAVYEKMLVGRR